MSGCTPGSECQARNCPAPKVCSDNFRCVLPGRAAWRRSGCGCNPNTRCQTRHCPAPKVCSDNFRCVLPGRAAWRRSGCAMHPAPPFRGRCTPHTICQKRSCPDSKVCSDNFRCVLPGRAAWRRSGCNDREDYDSDETDVEDEREIKEEDELKSPYVRDFNPCRPEGKEDREAARETVYRCPGCVGKIDDIITQEPIVNPVCLDQQCYDATSLRQWLAANPRAPLSGRPYTAAMLDGAMLSGEAPGDSEMCFHQGSWVNLDDDGNETVDDDEMVTEVWKPEVAS